MRLRHILTLLCAMLIAPVAAQTSQPAAEQWTPVVGRLAEVLTRAADNDPALVELLADNVPIQRLGSGDAESRYQLKGKTSGWSVISMRSYEWPAATIASDLATDLRDCESLPPPVRKQFIPRDDAGSKKANATAQQWVANVLQPASGQFVAVIVLCEPKPMEAALAPGSFPTTEAGQPMFVLVKGQKDGSTGEVRIAQIAFGDARQALN